jgi:hypothetical protein
MDSICGKAFEVEASLIGENSVIVRYDEEPFCGEILNRVTLLADFLVARVLPWARNVRIVFACWQKRRQHDRNAILISLVGHGFQTLFGRSQRYTHEIVDAALDDDDPRV